MTFDNLSADQKFLAESALSYCRGAYGTFTAKYEKGIHDDLRWRPAFYFKKNDHEVIGMEICEDSPYPALFRIIHAELAGIPSPISCYAVCPESLFLQPSNQKDVKDLRKHGYGLLTVSETGEVTEQIKATPAVHFIPDAHFQDMVTGYRAGKVKSWVVSSYKTYKLDPLSGVRELSDGVESAIKSAAGLCNSSLGTRINLKGTTSAMLNDMMGETALINARSSIGSVMGFYSEARNPSNHPPKNAQASYKKYRKCKENFINGVRDLESFVDQMRTLKITVRI